MFLASVLFLVGISSHFPSRGARYGLIALAPRSSSAPSCSSPSCLDRLPDTRVFTPTSGRVSMGSRSGSAAAGRLVVAFLQRLHMFGMKASHCATTSSADRLSGGRCGSASLSVDCKAAGKCESGEGPRVGRRGTHSLDGRIQVKIVLQRGKPPGSQLHCSSPDTYRRKHPVCQVVTSQLTAKQHPRSLRTAGKQLALGRGLIHRFSRMATDSRSAWLHKTSRVRGRREWSGG